MENSDVTSNETNIVLQIPNEVTEILADADLSSFENQVPTPMEMGKNFETIAVKNQKVGVILIKILEFQKLP